jgi:hypothetical protein
LPPDGCLSFCWLDRPKPQPTLQQQTSPRPIVTILNGKNDKFRIKLIRFKPSARRLMPSSGYRRHSACNGPARRRNTICCVGVQTRHSCRLVAAARSIIPSLRANFCLANQLNSTTNSNMTFSLLRPGNGNNTSAWAREDPPPVQRDQSNERQQQQKTKVNYKRGPKSHIDSLVRCLFALTLQLVIANAFIGPVS